MPRLIILIRKKHRRTSYKISSNYSEESLMDIDEENELILRINKEIDKLPAQCKKVFKLCRFEYKEIAVLLALAGKPSL